VTTTVLAMQHFRDRVASPPVAVTIGYLACLTVAEMALLVGGMLAGAVAHSLVLLILLVHHIAAPGAVYRPLLLGLALLPLMRLLALTIPLAEVPYLLWYVMIGLPMLLAALLVVRAERIDPRLIGLTSRFDPLVQLGVALAGIPLGLLAWAGLQPAAAVADLDPVSIALTTVVALAFVAFIEELVFRGLIQGLALHAFGSSMAAVAVSTAANGVLVSSSLSPSFLLVTVVVAALFGWLVEATGALWGVIVGRALITIGLFAVWPILLGGG
jgi:membrane protease YdiL (CAAX protease family)